MQQGICNPEFYGDLVYKFKKIIGNPNFRGWSCEPNNQLNVCTTSVTEGEVAGVKLV